MFQQEGEDGTSLAETCLKSILVFLKFIMLVCKIILIMQNFELCKIVIIILILWLYLCNNVKL